MKKFYFFFTKYNSGKSVSFGDKKVKKLPQMIGYFKCFESNKTMSFKINDNILLKKYNQILKKVKNLSNIKFGSEPVYGDNDKYLKTKYKNI